MIKVDAKEGKLKVETTQSYTLPDITILLLNGLLFMMNKALEKTPTDQQKQMKENIYDMVNIRMTAVLEKFAPEFELRPGLTEQALLEAENTVLEKRMKKVQ